jgi:undecaprenyl-diphosphatase
MLLALGALVLFERLADEMSEGKTLQLDMAIRGYIHGLSSPWFTVVMRIVSAIGDIGRVMAATTIAASVLWLRNRRSGSVLLALTTFGGVILMWALKLLFNRQRPEPFFGIIAPKDYSFPSGHALVAFCFYGALASIVTTEQLGRGSRIVIWIAAAFMVLSIGVSRIYLGVHYPSDVVAGYLAALVWVTGVFLVYRRFRERNTKVR